MRTNGKYRLNRKPLSSEEINRMQDFDAVLRGAQGKDPKGGAGGGSGRWLYIAGAVVIVVGSLLTWTFLPSNEIKEKAISRQVEQKIPETMPRTQEDSEDLVREPLVRLPVKNWEMPFKSYTLQAEKGGEIKHPSGTLIRVSPKCLIDPKGKTVRGPVEFRYREFFDPIDIALSNITMDYDSNGQHYYFETGGMCELRAFQNGAELSITPDKPIEVRMPAKNPGNFNLYYLDPKKGWQAKGNPERSDKEGILSSGSTEIPVVEAIRIDSVPPTIGTSPALEKVQQEIKQLEAQKPKAPRKANINRPRFNLDVDLKDFPELSDFKNMQFEVALEDKVFSQDMYKVEWNHIALKRHSPTRYKMVLTKNGKNEKDTRVVELLVIPVIEEKDYSEAIKKYDQLLKDYNQKLAAKKAEEERLKEEAQKQREAWQKEYERREKEYKEVQEVMNVFSINQFGVWNIDHPELKNLRTLVCSFHDDNGEKLQTIVA
ncbi:MAG: hypothetical protein LPK45_04550, partial [Bacteroidota bacterium]|nr:hypothetical protein [Bacteroidota bacterium]MDX5430325.1 hypothetical protein [Bacteroidota bacterium]MDX5469086.1 hypothetical protein [Bacteroidota bacterium]